MTTLLLTARARQVIAQVAAAHHITVQEIESPSRELHYARARQSAMYVLRKGMHLSLPMIGRLLHRDHSTVMHGIGVVEASPSLRERAWRVIGTLPAEVDVTSALSDATLQRFVADLDHKIAAAQALRRILGGELPA